MRGSVVAAGGSRPGRRWRGAAMERGGGGRRCARQGDPPCGARAVHRVGPVPVAACGQEPPAGRSRGRAAHLEQHKGGHRLDAEPLNQRIRLFRLHLGRAGRAHAACGRAAAACGWARPRVSSAPRACMRRAGKACAAGSVRSTARRAPTARRLQGGAWRAQPPRCSSACMDRSSRPRSRPAPVVWAQIDRELYRRIQPLAGRQSQRNNTHLRGISQRGI